MLAAAGDLLVPPLAEPLDEVPAEPDDDVLDGEFEVVEPEDDSDPPDLLVALLDAVSVLAEPEDRESVR
ncbi:hypothetical protein ACQPYA_03540 [Micromonospora sp. CA-263727]|uniref:hypothetical protein n=1 Tax=Micromonospora sp. CA-263727 TaxID=3239967 RepID=UPI003D8E073A